jgi:beta-lactamase superfamily II metal-dependent hydrolase
MMGYVFKTSDEKIIVIDGGTNGDTDNLYNTIKEMSGLEIPHVDAWILTHPHSDHINAFMTIIEEKWDAIEIDKIYYNFPTEEFVAQYENSSLKTIQRFNSLKLKFEDKLVVSEVGDKYTIGEAKIDVLFVFDDTITFNPINNSSMIFRLTAGGKKMMFLGDAYVQAGQILLDKYKVRLDSDYCQMAHHGQAGVNSDVYKIISPSVCFWDAPDWLWDNDSGGGVGSGPWGTLTVRAWMESFKVELHVVEKDGNNYFDFDTGVLITK